MFSIPCFHEFVSFLCGQDYNVIDYDEKVLDGFYDIYGGLSINSASHGKMPSLMDLQTSIGDLGFEVIIVNRAIDPGLVELEQVAQCISLDFREAEVGFLAQRISELVAQHMGGPVKDAHDMLTRWMEKSLELRTSQQTSLLPIGCINIGLSRHRSLLFKVCHFFSYSVVTHFAFPVTSFLEFIVQNFTLLFS